MANGRGPRAKVWGLGVMVIWTHLAWGSPGGAGTVLGFGGRALAHWQTALTVELVGVEKPACLLRGQGHFLAVLRGAFLLARFRSERLVFVFLIVAGCAGRHIWSGDAPLEFLQCFAQLLAFVAHTIHALLHFTEAVHEIGRAH